MKIAIISAMISGLLLQTAFQPLNSVFPSAAASSAISPITDYNGDGYTDIAFGAPYEDFNGESAGAVNVIYGSPSGGLSATFVPNQLWSQSVPGVKDLGSAADRFGATLASADFNNDGYTDLAIAAPGDDINGIVNAGGVNVLYGSSGGLVVDGNQFWHRGSPGIKGINTSWPDKDNFGRAMAVGDFNGDGYYDLAISSRGNFHILREGPGEVNVLYGSAAGLTADGNQRWSQASAGIQSSQDDNNCFGCSLAVGDFNDDGYHDLAVGIPMEDFGAADGAGAAEIIYGSPNGLSTAASGCGTLPQFWRQSTPGVKDVSEASDNFGKSMAAGDFNGDHYSDLAIGSQEEDPVTLIKTGAINALFGSACGLTAEGNQLWSLSSQGITEGLVFFGGPISKGDFNDDGFDDLIFGATNYYTCCPGAVRVLYGSANGLSAQGNQYWLPQNDGIKEGGETSAYVLPYMGFGYAIGTGDYNHDGYADAAIGAPFGNSLPPALSGGRDYSGDVSIIFGSPSGLASGGIQFWSQDSPHVRDTTERFDRFGYSIS